LLMSSTCYILSESSCSGQATLTTTGRGTSWSLT
jgi:hypothetical protein